MSVRSTPDSVPSSVSLPFSSRSQIKRRSPHLSWIKGFILPIILLVLWEILAQTGFFPPNLLPAPSSVLATIWNLAVTGALVRHVGATLYRVVIGFAIGSIFATVLGALTGYSRNLYNYLDPLLQALRNIPSLAWVPLFILWMGIQEASKVSLIAVGVFFPVYLNLMSGVQGVDRKLVEVGRVYRFSSWQLIDGFSFRQLYQLIWLACEMD